MKKRICILSVLICLSGAANALQVITGKVTTLESTSMPTKITFTLDTGNTACPAGIWLTWQKNDPENNKATYSLLMAALMSGKKVNFFINDNDTSCTGQFMHLTNS